MGINEPAARLRPRTEPSDPAETGVLIVDLAALADNWRTMARLAGGAECGAVVKADAYGLGLAPAMRALLSAGCRTFFVANVVEGEAARAVAHDATIYVLDGLVPGAAPRLVAADLIPALGFARRNRRMGGDWAQAQSRDPFRHGDESLRHSDQRGGAGGRARAPHRAYAGDEPFRQFATARRPLQRPADRGVPRRPRALRRDSGVYGEFLGRLPAAAPAFRSRSSRLRAVWRQPHALRRMPGAAGRAAQRAHSLDARDRARRLRRL